MGCWVFPCRKVAEASRFSDTSYEYDTLITWNIFNLCSSFAGAACCIRNCNTRVRIVRCWRMEVLGFFIVACADGYYGVDVYFCCGNAFFKYVGCL